MNDIQNNRRLFTKRLLRRKLSPFFFTNEKTFGVSIDTSRCIFGCKKCYSKRIMSLRPLVRRAFHTAVTTEINREEIYKFKTVLDALINHDIKHLRFFSLGDFSPKSYDLMTIAAIHGMKVSAISKSIHLPQNRKYIRLLEHPNIFLNLSFNECFSTNYIQEIAKYVGTQPNIQFHWTFICEKDKHMSLYKKFHDIHPINYDIYHTTARDKKEVAKIFGENRTCCLTKICDSCRLCYKDNYNDNGERYWTKKL